MKTKYSWIHPIAIIGLLLTFTFGCEKDEPVEISFAGGIGTQGNPYLIATPEQLDGVRHNLNKHFRQLADIDLSGYSSGKGWQPIGDNRKGFSGTFDGNGYKITNLTINRPETDNIGLFGYAVSSSTLKNIGLKVINITGNCNVGGIVGNSKGDWREKIRRVKIINCFASGYVSGECFVGGLVGNNWFGYIIESYAIVDIIGGDSNIGGLVGWNHGWISDSYAVGHVSGKDIVGGLAGGNSVEIRYSYATGGVTGNSNIGGLVGIISLGGAVGISYYDKETTGQEDTGKGIPKTTVEMMQKATFEEWDFTDIWVIDEGNSYPYMRWQE